MEYDQINETRTRPVRVQRLQGPTQPHHGRASFRDRQARSRLSKASRTQSEQARTKAETKARRWPRPCRLAGFRFQLLPAPDQCVVSKALADDSRKQQLEAVVIVHVLAVVKPERLFVNVAEQVVRLHGHVGSVDSALQQTPEVLKPVSVDVFADVLNRMIHNLMGVFFAKAVIGLQRVAVECGLRFDVLADQRLQLSLAATVNHLGADLPAAFQNRRNNRFTFRSASALDLTRLRFGVHVSRLAADESFVYFNASLAAAQLAASPFILHGKPNPMEHEPCGLLSAVRIPHDLVATDTVFGVGNHPSSSQPLNDRDRGIPENRFGLYGKLL